MTRHSVQARYKILVEGYGFLSIARNIGKYVSKNIRKNFSSSKYIHNLLDHIKQSATDALKIFKKND